MTWVPRRGVPVPDPLPPGVDAGHRGQRAWCHGAAVHPDLDRVDALVLRPGDAGHRRAARADAAEPLGHVDPGLGLDRRLLRPAALGPVGVSRRANVVTLMSVTHLLADT